MMPDPAAAHSAFAALIAGAVTSLHCAGMCGPLACSWLSARSPSAPGGDDVLGVGSAYHLARLSAYAALGAAAGGVGRLPLLWLSESVLRWLPWTAVLVLIALAFRWDRRLPHIPALSRLGWRLRLFPSTTAASSKGSSSRFLRAAALGAATPLLPCGPLYIMVGFSVFAGSAARGAELMLAFGLGTIPALWLVQTQYRRLQAHLSPRALARVRCGLSLAAALVLSWRLRGTLGFEGPEMTGWVCF